MKISIHAHHLRIPEDLPTYLEKHLTKPLARLYDDAVAELEVRLDDTRLRRGGVDQQCTLSFRMPGLKTLHVEAVAADIHAALIEAADKLKQAVKKTVGKRRTPGRATARRPAR